MVAARQPEGLAAILPWDGAFDIYREIAFYGGNIVLVGKLLGHRSVSRQRNATCIRR
jgi:uncharacterized protein